MTTVQAAPEATVWVGGLRASAADLSRALEVLRSSPGMMVRQPLQRAGSLLAGCDYHAVAAPYKARFSTACITGRGAAGRHITKQAFMVALEEMLAWLLPLQPLVPVIGQAWQAFINDCSYAAEIASEAVRLLQERHSTRLRTALQQASHQAVSACEARRGEFTCDNQAPCGTGCCRFTSRRLAFIAVRSVQGPARRPANHVRAGTAFSAADALPELEAAEPFQVTAGVR